RVRRRDPREEQLAGAGVERIAGLGDSSFIPRLFGSHAFGAMYQVVRELEGALLVGRVAGDLWSLALLLLNVGAGQRRRFGGGGEPGRRAGGLLGGPAALEEPHDGPNVAPGWDRVRRQRGRSLRPSSAWVCSVHAETLAELLAQREGPNQVQQL